MEAMIFAAGKGTRLKPITNSKPKALIEVAGKPLLEIVIRRLIKYGFTKIIINVHHFAEQIINFVEAHNSFGITILFSDEKAQLLDTGGGLKKAKDLFSDKQPILLHNVDILTNLNLKELMDCHLQNNAIATLAVQKRDTSRYLIFDKYDSLIGWENQNTGEKRMQKNTPIEEWKYLAFSGIHIVNPQIFDYLKDGEVFSIIETYLQIAASQTIKAFRHDESLWYDVGKPALLQNKFETELIQNNN